MAYYEDDEEFDDEYEGGEEDQEEDDDEWDENFEDEGEGDGYGDDIGDGYGEEDNSYHEEEGLEQEEEGKKGERKKAQQDDDDQELTVKQKNKKPEKDFKKVAKSLGFPSTPVNSVCPACKKRSLFPDKFGSQFKRGIMSSIIGVPSQNSIERFVCCNPRCRNYFPVSGIKYSSNGTSTKTHKNIFHVIR